MLDHELETSLNMAFHEARSYHHEFITVEHLLLALLENPSVMEVLDACGADIPVLSSSLRQFIKDTTPLLPNGVEQIDHETQPTLGFQRVLQRAVFHVQSSGKEEVTGANVLVAIYSEQESQAVYLLHSQGIHRVDVINFMSHGISRLTANTDEEAGDVGAQVGGEKEADATALDNYTTNLNEQARQDLIDPLVGREAEIERAAQILCRRRKNNPLLVGEPGVGKTAIAEGLALMIVEDKVPEALGDAVIYSLDMGALLAGTKYRGDFEKRFKMLLAELKKQPHAVLFIDEIHTIIGAGAASGGVMDASNLLKPMLASGQIKCMGSTTFAEFRGVFEKDHALSRRFQKIDVVEPSVEQTVGILEGLNTRFADYHKVTYTTAALRSAAELSARFITDRFLPDKAIDVIDEAGAWQKLHVAEGERCVDKPDIESIVSKMARIPPRNVSSDDRKSLQRLERDLKMTVFGQDQAIDMLSASIKLARAGLKQPDKPVGSFVFAGPTGVGKTEICRQLANILGVELVRFDMSEYMERHTVSRLIGAPPGYVGYDQGGLLTEAITKTPHCVLLLDEIEKAHQEVYNLLLQVMDNGSLTDNNGRKADFRNVILVMTTNAGAEKMSRTSIGFTEQDHSTDGLEALKKVFTPEFRNRLDGVVQFNHLSPEVILNVVDKFLVELQVQLDDKQITLETSKAAREWLAKKGYDRDMGARPMARTIQEHLKKPLSELLLFGQLADKAGRVKVDVKGDALSLSVEMAEAEPA